MAFLSSRVRQLRFFLDIDPETGATRKESTAVWASPGVVTASGPTKTADVGFQTARFHSEDTGPRYSSPGRVTPPRNCGAAISPPAPHPAAFNQPYPLSTPGLRNLLSNAAGPV